MAIRWQVWTQHMEANYVTIDAFPRGLHLIRKRDGRLMGRFACLADAAQSIDYHARQKARQMREDAREGFRLVAGA